jgi:hypothetical protein
MPPWACRCAAATVELLLLQDPALWRGRLWDSHLGGLEGGAHWQRHLHSKGCSTALLVGGSGLLLGRQYCLSQ